MPPQSPIFRFGKAFGRIMGEFLTTNFDLKAYNYFSHVVQTILACKFFE